MGITTAGEGLAGTLGVSNQEHNDVYYPGGIPRLHFEQPLTPMMLCSLPQLAGQGSSSSAALQSKTEELSRQYNQTLNALRDEKDKELQMLKVRGRSRGG